jgi:hypothetical protein
MTEAQAGSTRAVSLTKDDLQELRQKLSNKAFDAREQALVQYLADQAEHGLNSAGDTDPLWTWTYRF